MRKFDNPKTIDEWRKDGQRYRIRRSCLELSGRIWLEEREAIVGSSWRRLGVSGLTGRSVFRVLRQREAALCDRLEYWLKRSVFS